MHPHLNRKIYVLAALSTVFWKSSWWHLFMETQKLKSATQISNFRSYYCKNVEQIPAYLATIHGK